MHENFTLSIKTCRLRDWTLALECACKLALDNLTLSLLSTQPVIHLMWRIKMCCEIY